MHREWTKRKTDMSFRNPNPETLPRRGGRGRWTPAQMLTNSSTGWRPRISEDSADFRTWWF